MLSNPKKKRDIRDKTKYSSFIHRKSMIGGSSNDQSQNLMSKKNILK
jgi:hypothetical protein